MSYGRIRQCLTSEMGRYYAIQRTIRALLMLQFTPSYVVPSQSIALRIQRYFSFVTVRFPLQHFPGPVRLNKHHIQAQAERPVTGCSALIKVLHKGLALPFLLASPSDRSQLQSISRHASPAKPAWALFFPPLTPVHQYHLHTSISSQHKCTAFVKPPPLSNTFLHLVYTLMNNRAHT